MWPGLRPGQGVHEVDKVSVPMVAVPVALAGPRMVDWFWVAIVVVNELPRLTAGHGVPSE
jgi:hypothetical protein